MNSAVVAGRRPGQQGGGSGRHLVSTKGRRTSPSVLADRDFALVPAEEVGPLLAGAVLYPSRAAVSESRGRGRAVGENGETHAADLHALLALLGAVAENDGATVRVLLVAHADPAEAVGVVPVVCWDDTREQTSVSDSIRSTAPDPDETTDRGARRKRTTCGHGRGRRAIQRARGSGRKSTRSWRPDRRTCETGSCGLSPPQP
jgi:hypothetical protein